MKQWILKKYELVLTILLIIMMCTTRMSVSIGNVVYGLLLLITICTCFIKRKELCIASSLKQYGIAYGIMLLCLLPSVFCSEDIGRALKYFFNIYVWKSLIVLPILLCIKSKSKLYTLLIACSINVIIIWLLTTFLDTSKASCILTPFVIFKSNERISFV